MRRNGSGRVGSGRDEKERNESGRDKTGRVWTGRDEKERNESGRDGMGRVGSGRVWTKRNGTSRVETRSRQAYSTRLQGTQCLYRNHRVYRVNKDVQGLQELQGLVEL